MFTLFIIHERHMDTNRQDGVIMLSSCRYPRETRHNSQFKAQSPKFCTIIYFHEKTACFAWAKFKLTGYP